MNLQPCRKRTFYPVSQPWLYFDLFISNFGQQFSAVLATCLPHHFSFIYQFLSIFFFWVLTFYHGAPQQMKCLRAAIQEINTWHVLKSCQSESFKHSKVLNITEKKWQHVNSNFHLKLQYIKFNNFKNEIQKLSKSGCLCYISL